LSYQVLIVSPHFPPINAADHQRVRMALPYFADFAWQPHVLAVKPEAVEGVCDRYLNSTVPEDIPVTYVEAFPVKYTKYFGLSNLGWRCLPYLASAGERLLKQNSFDLIYFSTTVFLAMGLAAKWYRQFKVPYILDFQDPWLSDYFQQQGVNSTPPGGKFKYGLAKFMASRLEPRAMRYVSHVTSVSPAYPEILRQRYPWLRSEQFTVLPFGAPEKDFELLPSLSVKQKIFAPDDGKIHWVYVGRGGEDMAVALTALFRAISRKRQENPDTWNNLRLHFVGTSYATKERGVKTIEPIAINCGIGDLVTEQPERIAYFEALQILTQSNGILLIGSDDPNYSASKIYPCILAKKPILAIFNRQSLVVDILHRTQAGEVITFDREGLWGEFDSPPCKPREGLTSDLNDKLDRLVDITKQNITTDWSVFESYTAHSMTEKLCQVFDRTLNFPTNSHRKYQLIQ
jgi:hypothetical protein